MAIVCGHCGKALEFSGDAPMYCAYCGVRLKAAPVITTSAPDAATVAYEGPSTVPEAVPPSAPPDVIGGYRLVRPLGSGGMGTVYEAVNEASGQHAAVKLLAAQFAGHPTSL